jgi:hypothetical protein
MSLNCGREKDVVAMLEAGHWPAACDAELREHVAGCARCGDLVLVTAAMQRARVEAMGEARLQASGVIWWRAQLRRRQAAMEAVARPVRGAQWFAGLVGLAVLVGFLVVEVRQGGVAKFEASWAAGMAGLSGDVMLVAVGLGVLAVLGGVAAWLAVDRE